MSRPIIAGYLRSPFTPAGKGGLAKLRPDDMAAQVMAALVSRYNLMPSEIDDVIAGCAFPEGEQGFNIGRMLVFLAGLPASVPGMTVNRWCGSSMEAVHIASAKIAGGQGQAYLCLGVESMSRVPMGGFAPSPNPALYASLPQAYDSMGKTAETLAERYHIPREAQEDFALQSHLRAAEAALQKEIAPMNVKGAQVAEDEGIRKDASLEKMKTLSPAFKASGTVTAATSSPMSDGAAAVLVCSEAYADKAGLPKLAAIKSCAIVGVPPEIMGIGAALAGRKLLEQAGLSFQDIGVIEINEAFAAQTLACLKEWDLPPGAVNLEGGAIALGHPLGASGARLAGKTALLMQRHNARYGLATLCIGGGQGIATLFERVES